MYHTRALHSIRAALDAGERKVLSFMRHAGANGDLPRVVCASEGELCADPAITTSVINVNTPEDLSAEQAHHAAKESA